jgi:DNA-binding IclR family transcriptional regulator
MKKSDATGPQKRPGRTRVALESPANVLRHDDELAEVSSDGETSSSYLVPGLERGLRILSEFTAREPELGAPELSKRIGIPRTTTFRLLQTLEALGFLERAGGDRRFRLGLAVLRLGFEYLNSLEVTEVSTPVLERLRDATGLSTHLLVRDQRDVIFVAKAQAREPMFSSVKVHVGTRLPAHATVHGQVLMGDLTLDELKQLYPEGKLERFTDQTPKTIEELHKRICTTAMLGYATSEASFERGISVVTAPVRDHSNHIVAALTATVPRSELGETAEREPLVTAVCGAALDVSQRLGYQPTEHDPTALLAQRSALASK